MSISPQSNTKFGLVLSGGGARAAYQAGVLQGVSQVLGSSYGPQPFTVITGLSAGAINASYLASAKSNFSKRAEALAEIWNTLKTEQVFQTSALSFTKLSLNWMKDLGLGGLLGSAKSTHILDSSPLREFLSKIISFDQIRSNISSGTLHGFGVTATSYATGTSTTFFDSPTLEDSWIRSSRIGVKTVITLDHVLASSAIPGFFQPVRVGNSYYGDGGIRSNAPFSAAIRLGADRLLAIGVRYRRSGTETLEINQQVVMNSITLADIAGVTLNSLFLDALDFDYERLQRINETVQLLSEEARLKHPGRLKVVPTLLIHPSDDLGSLAADEFKRFPGMLQYLLRGIGATSGKGADFLSYIAFSENYTQRLVSLGLKDAHAHRDEILDFFNEDKEKAA